MKKLLIATTNKGKLQELSEFLNDLPVQLVSLEDIGIAYVVDEDGSSYEENSQKKARAYAEIAHLPAIADDGGLEISALNGAPGLKSRRWLGYEGTDIELIQHIQNVANELPDKNRNAQFVTVVSFSLPTGEVWSERGEVEGIIVRKPYEKILQGYPYRSFFYIPQIKKFYHESELTTKEMKIFNHLYKAINRLKNIIRNQIILD